MPSWRWLLTTALAASAIASAAEVQAQDEDQNAHVVSIDEVPAPAREAILREADGGTLMEVHEETWQKLGPVYEGHFRLGRRETFIWVDAAGNVLHRHG